MLLQTHLKLLFLFFFGFAKFLSKIVMDYRKSRRIIQLSFKHENIKYTYVLLWLPAATAILGTHTPCRWLKIFLSVISIYFNSTRSSKNLKNCQNDFISRFFRAFTSGPLLHKTVFKTKPKIKIDFFLITISSFLLKFREFRSSEARDQ